MIVWPGLRRSVSAIRRLFNSASFDAPLTHSAIPTRAASGTTATFTRATTKTWQNNDGYLVTGVAGEIGFVGARRVDNLIRLGAAQSSTLAVAASVTMTLPAGAYQFSMGAGTGTVTFSGTGGATGTLAASASGRTFVAKTISAGTLIVTASVATLIDIQVVSMVAETDQATLREYVSVGAPGDWLGTEHVTNGTFDTDTTGWTAANSATLSATGSELTITNAGATYGYAYQALTTVIGTKYVLSCTARRGTVATVFLQAGNTPGTGVLVNQSSTSTTNVQLKAEFTATATTTYVTLISDNTNNGTAIFDSVSCKPALYHGSFVDGVKCFPTDLSGNAIPSTTLLGYSAEGARTNVCLQSNAFTTTWAAVGTPAATQNVVGPDGGTTAWTLTDNDGAVTEGISQDITLTAATHTFSVFVKKTSGATSFPIIYAYDLGANVALCTIDSNNGVATVWTAYTALTIVTSSARCVSYNDDYWRVSLTYLPTAASWRHYIVPAGTTSATQATGTLNVAAQGSAVFYGAQVELGSFASSYIATTTIAVAMNADVLTYSSAGNISGTVGWCYAEITTASASTAESYVVVAGNNATDGYPMYISSSTGKLSLWDETAVRGFGTPTRPITTPTKVCTTWGGSTSAGAINGAVTTGSFDGDIGVGTALGVGGTSNGLAILQGNIKNVRIGQRQLSASELQAITA